MRRSRPPKTYWPRCRPFAQRSSSVRLRGVARPRIATSTCSSNARQKGRRRWRERCTASKVSSMSDSARLSFAKKTGVDSISSFSSRFSGRARKPANRVSNPRRTEALDFREVGIVRDNATPETKRRGGNHAVRHRQIPMHALQEPGLARQLRVELHHLQASVLKGPELGQRLSTARLLTDGVRHLCNHDGRKNSPPFLAQRGQLRSSPGKNFLVLRPVVGEQEFRVQDFLQSLSSRDFSRTFNRRSRVVFFEREPPRSSRLGTGRMSNESPRSSTSSRLPSSMR